MGSPTQLELELELELELQLPDEDIVYAKTFGRHRVYIQVQYS